MVFDATFLDARSTASRNYSQAFVVPPSGVWDGNDGAWSTFVIRVGNPAQYFRVLPATSSDETWVPAPNDCDRGMAWCGNGRGVEPFNAGTSGPASGSPNGVMLASVDAGATCTANKSPMCRTQGCNSIDGKCTGGPCPGRFCCGDSPGICNTGGCNGISGICTGGYIGCPCPGADFNAGAGIPASPSAANPLNAHGFLPNASTSWSDQGKHWVDTIVPLYQPEQAQYGVDTVGLGADASSGLTLNGSIVAGVGALPIYLGQLGLQPSNTSGPGQGLQSFMSQLVSQKKIPSNSYGYSAGALYQQKPVLGSLTLGGYDASRLIPNDISFPITGANQLRVPVQAITTSGSFQPNGTLLSKNITALIDTTTPQSWLPLSVCQAFEAAFGLTWDNATSLYLVNDSVHQQLLNNNPSVTFNFGQSSSLNHSINITLPYAAFDLQAAAPIYSNGTNYFPIRRAENSSFYAIGRTLFQEAYLTVDYEAGNFSVSQANYPAPQSSNIITIDHHPAAPTAAPSSAGSNLSTAGIVGVAIGVCLVLLLVASSTFLCLRSRHHASQSQGQKKQPRKSSLFSSESFPPELDGWPDTPSFNEKSPPDSSMGRSSSNMTSSTYIRSPTNELGNTFSSAGSIKSKPLPKLPVELPAEVASELMEKSRSRHHTPRGRRSRSTQDSFRDQKSEIFAKF